MSEATEADREKAAELVDQRWDLNAFSDELANAIAQALADERAKARDLDVTELMRAVRDAAKRQNVSEHEVIWQLIEVADTNGYAADRATDARRQQGEL